MPVSPGAGLTACAALMLWEGHAPVAKAAERCGCAAGGLFEKRRSALQASLCEGRPFLPSNATTDTGEFIDPKSFPTAKYCGHCHQQAHAEWRQTAHANSFRDPWYVKNVNLLMNEQGIEYTRHCEGCHNPDRAGFRRADQGLADRSQVR